MSLNDLLNKLEAQEQDFISSEVLAPVLAGRAVTVRIAGVVCKLQVDDKTFHGWGVLQPQSTDHARIVRPARRNEIQEYLKLLPAVRLLSLARPEQLQQKPGKPSKKHRDKNTWYALPAHKGDARFEITKPIPVLLCEEGVQPFDAIIARFDGKRFWYERPNARHNPALSAYLRESFNQSVEVENLNKKGLSNEEREAYEWAYQFSEEARRRGEEARIINALAHAQGSLLSYIERDDVYTVTFRVNNRTHTSTVRKDDLTILTSGICLSGRDRDFDLTSVVGVMREAATIGMEEY